MSAVVLTAQYEMHMPFMFAVMFCFFALGVLFILSHNAASIGKPSSSVDDNFLAIRNP